jgi:drug/metabolite transporter (DMT)-like permease
VAVVLGLLVAASFGSGDFLGGLGARRAPTLLVLALAQVTALLGALVVAFAAGGQVTGRIVGLGAAAGLLNMVALGCLYRGLAIGQVGQVAPIAAVVGAIEPITWGVARGERLSVATLIGVALAVVAGGLVSAERRERQGPLLRRGLPLAVAAGVGFGTSFILFAEVSHGSGFWPVLSARAAAAAGAVVAVLVLRLSPRRLVAGSSRLGIGAGALDVTASSLLLVALRHGLIAVVAPVAALAPGFTVMHAWWYLHERASGIQVVGIALALVGLTLIAVG